MLHNYFKRGTLLLGAAAVAAAASAGDYVDVTRHYITDPTYMPGWQGFVGATADGVAEAWSGAFRLYQILDDMPAGTYTLSADAFYRCGSNDFSKANQVGKPELNTATIFVNEKHANVKALWEGRETAPNTTAEASTAFTNGEYKNSLTYEHKGGQMVIGIMNTGCYRDEWCCFDNFKLVSGSTDYTSKIVNADFSEGLNAKRAWNNVNSENKEKTPDIQKDGSGAGAYRKCGGSPYNIGQQVELPAGKYRFGMYTFHRYGSTMDANGTVYQHKWPCNSTDAYGYKGRSAKDWYVANDYDQVDDTEYAHAYIYMSKNEAKPKTLAWSESDAEGDLVEGADARTRIKDCWEICNGDLSIMPDNNPRCGTDGYTETYEVKNKCTAHNDSGSEREAGAAFFGESADKWFQYVDFELTATTKVWLGLGKDGNSSDGYWHPWADIKLMKWDDNAAGIAGVVVDDENAPVEYYNLQGVRVANPENGLYIVKQGKKVSKKFIR